MLTCVGLNKFPTPCKLEESNFYFTYVRLCGLDIPRKKAKLFDKSGYPDQMLYSDLGLHCLPIIHFVVSRLKWVKVFKNLCYPKAFDGLSSCLQ